MMDVFWQMSQVRRSGSFPCLAELLVRPEGPPGNKK